MCGFFNLFCFSLELLDAVKEVLPHLHEQQITVFILADRCETAGVESFIHKMNQASSEPIPKELRSHLTMQSPAAYIYTSGTTGNLLTVIHDSSMKEMADSPPEHLACL